MAAITALTEPFEGTVGNDLTTGNTIVDTFNGGASTATKFTATHYSGTSSCELITGGTMRTMQFNLTAAGLVYFDIYVDVATAPSATTGIVQWFSGTTKVGEVRLVFVTSTTFQFQIRDVNTARWTGTTVGVGQYRIAVKIDPNVATGHQLRVFTGSTIDTTTAVQDSGTVSATNAAVSTIDNVKVGVTTNVTATIRFDDMTADDAGEVIRGSTTAPTTLPVKVRVGGAWVTATSKTYRAGAWV